MENLAHYLILLLSGIILGGAAVGSLMARVYRPTPPEYAYRQHPAGALASLLLFSGFILLLLLGGYFLSGPLPPATPAPARSKMSLEVGQPKNPASGRRMAPSLGGFYIQTGAYDIWDRAERAAQTMENQLMLPTGILYFESSESPYKTVVGPFPTYSGAAAQMEENKIEGILLEYTR